MQNLYYFVSDVHLGLRAGDYKELERKFIGFLDSLPPNLKALYLLGDIFDFWYEYKYVIPRGHTRVLGRLAALVDRGVEVYFFSGNHDVWAYNYFEEEIGMKVLQQPAVVEIEGKRFCLGHGDGLGDIPFGFKALRWLFHNRVCQILFSAIHPRWAFGLGYSWSKHTRIAKLGVEGKKVEYQFRGVEEPIYKFADNFGEQIDYYIFGHFHANTSIDIPSGGRMYILGEWINVCDYLVFDGESISQQVFCDRAASESL